MQEWAYRTTTKSESSRLKTTTRNVTSRIISTDTVSRKTFRWGINAARLLSENTGARSDEDKRIRSAKVIKPSFALRLNNRLTSLVNDENGVQIVNDNRKT